VKWRFPTFESHGILSFDMGKVAVDIFGGLGQRSCCVSVVSNYTGIVKAVALIRLKNQEKL
jgi:hypothetical protein